MLGFPVAFTLMALGIGFGYYAYYDAGACSARLQPPRRRGPRLAAGASGPGSERFFGNRIFDLFVNQTYSVMSNDVLTAIPLFLFMGYIVERANIVTRLFTLAADRRARPARLARASRRSSPARCSPPPPASSAPWSR